MKFSKAKTFVFFTTLLVLFWFLYPRALFLGFVYEGSAELKKAEQHYLDYLTNRPFNKFATLRLVGLYARMGSPERGTALLKELYHHRKNDWKIAERYLQHLEDINDEEGLYHLRREVVQNFMKSPLFPKGKVLQVLEDALNYAVWVQKSADVYEIIQEAVQISRRSQDYLSIKADYDRGLQDDVAVLRFLEAELVEDRKNIATRKELAHVYSVKGGSSQALKVLSEGIEMDPQSQELLEARIVLYVTQKKLPEAIKDTRALLALDSLYFDERREYTDKLSVFYYETKREKELLALYQKAVHSDKLETNDRLVFAERLDIFYRDRKQMDQVLELYETILAISSIEIGAKFEYIDKLAYLYGRKKQYKKTLKLYRDNLDRSFLGSHERAALYENLAYAHTQQKNRAKVIEVYQEAVDAKELLIEDRMDFIEKLVSLYSKQAEIEKGIALYRKALAFTGLDSETHANIYESMAYLYGQLKKNDQMIAIYREGIESQELELKHRLNFVEQLAGYHLKRGAYDEVLSLYREVLGFEGLESSERANTYEQIAFIYNKKKQPEKVITIYQEAMASEELGAEDKINFMERLAAFFKKRNMSNNIVPLYQEALTFDGLSSQQRANLLEHIAHYHLKQKEREKVYALYEEAIASDALELNERIYFIEQLAGLYIKSKSVDQALPLYRKGIQFKGLNAKYRGYLLEQLAFLYFKKNQKNKVIELYQEALSWEDLESKDRLNFIELLASLYARMGKQDKRIALYQKEIVEGKLEIKEWINLIHMLAEIRTKDKQLAEAEKLYRQALDLDREDPDNWINLIYLLDELKKTEEQIDLLRHYLSRFPEDQERLKLLVEIYLYNQKDLSQMPLYSSYVQSREDEEVAMGVTDLLLKSRQQGKAAQWVKECYRFFPQSPDLPKMIIDDLMKDKMYKDAISFVQVLLELHPNNPYLLTMAALLHATIGDIQTSEKNFKRLDELAIQDPAILHWIGKECYFAGHQKRGRNYLAAAAKKQNDRGDYWFWYAKALYADEQEERGLRAMHQAEEWLALQQNKGVEEMRMYLKAQGRTQPSQSVEQLYFVQITKHPKEISFYEDLFDHYIETKEIEKATDLLVRFERQFPKETRKNLQLQARLADANKDWQEAIRIQQQLLAKDPTDLGARSSLAAYYYNAGQWPEAIQTYKDISTLSADEKSSLGPVKNLYALYDNRLTLDYQGGIYGTDTFHAWKSHYQSFLTRDLKFEGEVSLGLYKAAADNFHDLAEKGEFTIEKIVLEGWSWKGGAGFGNSPIRTTPTAFVSFPYLKPQQYGLNVSFDYRELRTDFPQAVAGGGLVDTAKLDSHYYLGKYLYLYSNFEFKRNYLPSGLKAYEYYLEPGFSVDLLKYPLVSFGYHFTFSQLDAEPGFVDSLPLLAKLRSHIFSLQLAHDINRVFFYGFNFFIGEDTAKNTHLFEGDLLGTGANFKWHLLPWLDFSGSYGFGKESLPSISGSSHQFGIAFSGHWH